ncbi:MAG TPA: acyl-CoA dehydrogenase family protein [Planctomycetaceae bacterium]|nr:acyl-CoA dehydrogenase family protein [Planctomycetaceae bacterium]
MKHEKRRKSKEAAHHKSKSRDPSEPAASPLPSTTAFEGVDFYRLDELLSPADIELRSRVRHWVQTYYMPVVAEHFERATFPLTVARQIASFGAFGGTIEGYGCAGLTALEYGLIMQELERGDSGLRTFASVQGALAMNAVHMFGSEEQKQEWLPAMARGEKLGCFGLTEPDFGSNPAGMTTTAKKTPQGYVLNGKKMWIGHGTIADVAVVWAKVDGEPGVDPASPQAIRGFLVEEGTPGFSAELIEGKLSLRAANTSRLAFTNCVVPAHSLLPKSGGLKSPLLCLNHARYGIAWGVLGAAMACFEEAREYAGRRIQFGHPIAAFQLVQRKLALMLTELTKAQLLAWRLAQLKEAGKATFVQISMAKRNNVAAALEIARTTRDILGGVGILGQHQCFRHMANLESVKTYEGTEDMHLLILGEKITGISAFE